MKKLCLLWILCVALPSWASDEELTADPRVATALGLLEAWVDAEAAYKDIPGVSIAIGDRTTTFHTELKGPVAIEQRKVDNVTEFVAVGQLNGDGEVLASTKLPLDELLKGFEDEPEPGSEPNPEASVDDAAGDQLSDVIGGSDAE